MVAARKPRYAVVEIVTVPVGIADRARGRVRDLMPSDDPTIDRLIRRLQDEVRSERAAMRDSRRGISASNWCDKTKSTSGRINGSPRRCK